MHLPPPKGLHSNKICITSSELVTIICYPNFSIEDYTARLNEIRSLGINAILVGGKTKIGRMNIVGKGCVGLVVKVEIEDKIYACKIRRTDADRKDMGREVLLHTIANSIGVGPNLFAHTENFIIMEFINGLTIIDWIRQQQNLSAYKVRDIVVTVLKKCYDLDKIHLDHGELSRLDRHVIISEYDNVNIIDFESSSNLRKISNVTSATQALLLNGVIARRINGLLKIPKNEIIQILRLYKQKPTRHNFDRLIHIIRMA
jgi:putative serine/threonine protein kinase